MNHVPFSGRVGLQQRVLPSYRVPFFERLASVCTDGLSIFAGEALAREGIRTAHNLEFARYVAAENRHFCHPGSVLYRCWQTNLIGWLEQWSPDVLIIEANPRYPNNVEAIDWMHERDRAVIGWGLGAPPIKGFLRNIRQRNRGRLLAKLDAVIAYSTLGASQYRSLGFPEPNIFVAMNAVLPGPDSPAPARPLKDPVAQNLLFVGRLQRRKRVDLLLRACSALPSQLQPNVWIIGDGSIRFELESLAKNIYPRAEFFGALFGSELDHFFERADLFVLPGTGGLAIQQAMSHGLAVISAQGDGTQADLVHSSNGWLIPPGDLETLTVALRDALSNPERLQRMGAESHRIVREEVNLDTMVSQFLNAIRAVSKRRK